MDMAEHWVRLGMALIIIALVSLGMYSFTSHARGVGPFTGTSFVLRP
jgi:hypothetical protein